MDSFIAKLGDLLRDAPLPDATVRRHLHQPATEYVTNDEPY